MEEVCGFHDHDCASRNPDIRSLQPQAIHDTGNISRIRHLPDSIEEMGGDVDRLRQMRSTEEYPCEANQTEGGEHLKHFMQLRQPGKADGICEFPAGSLRPDGEQQIEGVDASPCHEGPVGTMPQAAHNKGDGQVELPSPIA